MHTSRRTYTVHHHVQSWFRGEGGNGDFTEKQLHHRTRDAQATGPTRRSVADDRVGAELADLLCAAAGGGDLGGPLQRLLA